MTEMCSNCLDDFDFLPYQYAVKEKGTSMIEVKETFCCFLCMKFWFEDESIEDWREKR